MDDPLTQPQPQSADAQQTEQPSTVAKNRKRPRTNETRVPYPRKRAVVACELCRLRKSKCDNQRPACGTCTSYGATCVFRDRDSDHSMFDQASLAILDRLNYAIRLLESPSPYANLAAQSQHPAAPAKSQDTPTKSTDTWNSAQDRSCPGFATQQSGEGGHGNLLDNTDAASTSGLNINSRASCVHVLDWPIFEGRIQPDSINPAFWDATSHVNRDLRMGMSTSNPSNQRSVPNGKSVGRIHEEDTLVLIEDFLRNVHTKNPILEPAELRELARVVAEEGFQWDVASCLVLIACALGSLSAPWVLTIATENENSLADAHAYPLAEAYYTAARKRLGLLESSVPATQCWFLTGIYEMYSMRPLSAWLSFNRACTLFQLHLQTQSRDSSQFLERSEQRLYWSCLKSEREMREEFDLPHTGLANVEYPDIFPSPPGGTPEPMPGSGEEADQSAWQCTHQSSWFYYLSEIAYRRIANRTITTLYYIPKEQWAAVGARRLDRIAQELDTQVLQWWQHIPGSPDASFQQDTDELTFMLWLNYVDIRERVWRPFLYLAVHGVLSEEDKSIVRTNAIKCLDLSFEMLDGSLLKHRHHGGWLTARCLVTKALLVLAAAKSGCVEIRSNWQHYLDRLQIFLRYWEVEAPDLGLARSALSELLAGIEGS